MGGLMNMRFLERAIELSLEGMRLGDGGPFGAVVSRGETVVGEAWNRVVVDCDPTAHAEVLAVRAACRRVGSVHLPDCELYASCEPCPMCLAAAYWAHIGTIYYANTREDVQAAGFDDADICKEFALPEESRTIRQVRVEGTAAPLAFQEWLAKEDRKAY